MRKILLYFALKYQGDVEKIYQAIKQKELVDQKEVLRIKNSLCVLFELYSAITNLKSILPSEQRQTQKATHCMIPFI